MKLDVLNGALDEGLKTSQALCDILEQENRALTKSQPSELLLSVVKKKDEMVQKITLDLAVVLDASKEINGGDFDSLPDFLKSLKTSEKDVFLNKYDKIMSNLRNFQAVNLKNGYIVNGLRKVNSEIINIVTGVSGTNEVTYGPTGGKSKPRKGTVKIGEV
jgi:flagellar biosynthesis/type III secretory pathway chaperone